MGELKLGAKLEKKGGEPPKPGECLDEVESGETVGVESKDKYNITYVYKKEIWSETN